MEDIHVLSLDATGSINHKDADVRILDSADGTQYGIVFDILADLVLLADTGCIDQIEIETELVVLGVDTVACSACNISHNMALFAHKCIEQRTLAGIGTTYDGKLGQILQILGIVLLETTDYFIKQITRS